MESIIRTLGDSINIGNSKVTITAICAAWIGMRLDDGTEFELLKGEEVTVKGATLHFDWLQPQLVKIIYRKPLRISILPAEMYCL